MERQTDDTHESVLILFAAIFLRKEGIKMARAIANCKCKLCGNEFQKIKTNCWNRDDANGWKEWVESNCSTCNESYRKMKQEENVERVKKMELPQLRGSEKQVAWAEKVRMEIVLRCDSLIKQLRDKQLPKRLAKAEKGFELLRRQTSASWWIDNRNMCDIYELLKEVVKAADQLKETDET